MDILFSKASCVESSCGTPAVISFGGQDFCLDHFISRCYARLDALEPMVFKRCLEPTQVPKVRALLDECSNRTLLVCLRHEALSNLDRSRLLEILLQCGDLQLVLRNLSLPKHPYRHSSQVFSTDPLPCPDSQQRKNTPRPQS